MNDTTPAAPQDARDFVNERGDYKYGFVTPIESDSLPPGLDEGVVRWISAKKGEPEWLTDWRVAAFRAWEKMTPPSWQNVGFPPIDYQKTSYFAAPKKQLSSMDEVDPEILATFEKLGVPLHERAALAGVAVDAVFDSMSVATTFKKKLGEVGIIFCSFGEAVREHPANPDEQEPTRGSRAGRDLEHDRRDAERSADAGAGDACGAKRVPGDRLAGENVAQQAFHPSHAAGFRSGQSHGAARGGL